MPNLTNAFSARSMIFPTAARLRSPLTRPAHRRRVLRRGDDAWAYRTCARTFRSR